MIPGVLKSIVLKDGSLEVGIDEVANLLLIMVELPEMGKFSCPGPPDQSVC